MELQALRSAVEVTDALIQHEAQCVETPSCRKCDELLDAMVDSVQHAKKISCLPGRGSSDVGEGTAATTRQSFDAPNPPSRLGSGSTPDPNFLETKRLALGSRSLSDSREWGKGLPGSGRGETGEGAVPGDGGRLPSRPLDAHHSSTYLVRIILDQREAISYAKRAIDELLPLIDVSLRGDIAVAASKLGHALRGGVL